MTDVYDSEVVSLRSQFPERPLLCLLQPVNPARLGCDTGGFLEDSDAFLSEICDWLRRPAAKILSDAALDFLYFAKTTAAQVPVDGGNDRVIW